MAKPKSRGGFNQPTTAFKDFLSMHLDFFLLLIVMQILKVLNDLTPRPRPPGLIPCLFSSQIVEDEDSFAQAGLRFLTLHGTVESRTSS